MRVEVCKARPIQDQEVPDVEIVCRGKLPEKDCTGRMDLDARNIVNHLYACLPGGTMGRLFAHMAMKKATSLVIREVDVGK